MGQGESATYLANPESANEAQSPGFSVLLSLHHMIRADLKYLSAYRTADPVKGKPFEFEYVRKD